MIIYVGNLAPNVDDAALRAAFEVHGDVSSAQVVMDRETGRSRGFGFVEMACDDHASAAIAALNGADLAGRALNVNEARPLPQRVEPSVREPLNDEVLGRLVWMDYGRVLQYEGDVLVEGQRISFDLRVDEDGSVAKALARAREVYRDFSKLDKAARGYAAEKLLKQKNEEWLGEEEDPVTPQEFQARMEPAWVSVSPDGHVMFFYNDDDMFMGHTITVQVDGGNRLVDADFSG